MMHPDDVKKLVEKGFSKADVTVLDMTGGQDHFDITVVSLEFEGKTMLEQHQMIQTALAEAMEDGRIHAIQLHTYTPEKWQKKNHLHNIG